MPQLNPNSIEVMKDSEIFGAKDLKIKLKDSKVQIKCLKATEVEFQIKGKDIFSNANELTDASPGRGVVIKKLPCFFFLSRCNIIS